MEEATRLSFLPLEKQTPTESRRWQLVKGQDWDRTRWVDEQQTLGLRAGPGLRGRRGRLARPLPDADETQSALLAAGASTCNDARIHTRRQPAGVEMLARINMQAFAVSASS